VGWFYHKGSNQPSSIHGPGWREHHTAHPLFAIWAGPWFTNFFSAQFLVGFLLGFIQVFQVFVGFRKLCGLKNVHFLKHIKF
jgi:hypothetical protein